MAGVAASSDIRSYRVLYWRNPPPLPQAPYMTRTAWAVGETRQEALWATAEVLADELFENYPPASPSPALQQALDESARGVRYGGFGTSFERSAHV
jgi:hypothetical protein